MKRWMAAAAFAIRDAGVPGEDIHILEQLGLEGGSLDGAKSPVNDSEIPIRRGVVTFAGVELEDGELEHDAASTATARSPAAPRRFDKRLRINTLFPSRRFSRA